MKLVIQRVSQAQVTVDDATVGAIHSGALVFIGITHTDTQHVAAQLAHKLVHLRFFEDAEGKMNRSLIDTHREMLIVSQFTLYADCVKGRRPSFTEAAAPDIAEKIYDFFSHEVQKFGIRVQTGVFGAKMNVSLVNDGPVTLLLEHEAPVS